MKLLPLSILAVSSLAAAEFAPDSLAVAGGDLTPTVLTKAGYAQTGNNGETTVSVAPAANFTLISGAATYTVNAGADAGFIAGDGYDASYVDGFANGEGLFDLSSVTRLIAAAGVEVAHDGAATAASFDTKTTVSAGAGVQLGDEAASDLVVVTRLGTELVNFDAKARETDESVAINALLESNYRLDGTLALLANANASNTTFAKANTKDAVGYGAEVGVAWARVAMSEGSFLLGAAGKAFGNNSAADFSGVVVKLNTVWTPTDLASVTLGATFEPTAKSVEKTEVSLAGAYAVASNLGLNAGVTYTNEASASTEVTIGTLYDFRRNIQLGAAFTHTAPDTGDATNAIEVTLNAGL